MMSKDKFFNLLAVVIIDTILFLLLKVFWKGSYQWFDDMTLSQFYLIGSLIGLTKKAWDAA